ncbi:MAG: extracellular solute-binding protein [Thermomicrobiales bacterium]|nr:extracellular solute-binding protein [Thermomicrobiales bacterium]
MRSPFGHQINRRRLLQAGAGAGLALSLPGRLAPPAAAQEVTFTKEFAGTKLNMLMEDLLETTIIEEMLPEFTELTGIEVSFEKVVYDVMHEKLVPQLAAGAGNGAYDVLEVDFYWVYEFARSGWVESLDERIADSGGAIDLSRYVPATLNIVSQADGKTWYVPFYAYPMGLIYRDDLLNDPEFQKGFKEQTGQDLAIPDSVSGYVDMAKAIKTWKGSELYGAAMTAQQSDPLVMEFCNFLYSAGGDYYNAEMTEPIFNNETGVKAAQLYADCVNNAAQPGASGANYNDSIAVYSQGHAFSSVSFMWMLAVVDGDDTSPVQGKNKSHVMPGGTGLSGAWGWGLPISSPNPDAGWQFIRWVESPDVAMRRALAGSLPTQQAPFKNPEVLAKYPWLEQAEQMIISGKGLPPVTKQTQLVEIVGRHMADVVSGAQDAQTALDAAAEELKGLL